LSKRRRKHFQPKPCAQCGTVFAPKSGFAKFCAPVCKVKWDREDRAAVLRSGVPGMDPEEERKMVARLKRRLLDGVLTTDLCDIYGKHLVYAVLGRLTPEERQQRADASDAGLQGLADRIGHTGGHWHKTNTVFFAPWKGHDWSGALK
jgi:hypothetical protein